LVSSLLSVFCVIIGRMDKYTAGIEVSNACRRFYVSRLQAAEALKGRLSSDLPEVTGSDRTTHTGHFGSVIANLRLELVS
jgi:hypothetical protein